MSALKIPPDFSDDLNYVVTAKEASRWYAKPYDEIRYELQRGALAGRLSFDTWLVSVDSLIACYGLPSVTAGRRARRALRSGFFARHGYKRAGNAVNPETRRASVARGLTAGRAMLRELVRKWAR